MADQCLNRFFALGCRIFLSIFLLSLVVAMLVQLNFFQRSADFKTDGPEVLSPVQFPLRLDEQNKQQKQFIRRPQFDQKRLPNTFKMTDRQKILHLSTPVKIRFNQKLNQALELSTESDDKQANECTCKKIRSSLIENKSVCQNKFQRASFFCLLDEYEKLSDLKLDRKKIENWRQKMLATYQMADLNKNLVCKLGTENPLVWADGEYPVVEKPLQNYRLDLYEVSVAKFALFVLATGYKTEAELMGSSFVFAGQLENSFQDRKQNKLVKNMREKRNIKTPWWILVPGSNWKWPTGIDKSRSDIVYTLKKLLQASPKANWLDIEAHLKTLRPDSVLPVVHTSWKDANHFCEWADKRLPTECEWEFACKWDKGDRFPWADDQIKDPLTNQPRANLWQGDFPNFDTGEDGFLGPAPVDEFVPNSLGIKNLIGNVWEWTSDNWQVDRSKTTEKQENWIGNSSKVTKGGSFLCHESYCNRFRCWSRHHSFIDTSASNLGFRCAADILK